MVLVGVLFEPNTDGLGIQDEYFCSDGVGRYFLNMNAGGLYAASEGKVKQHFYFSRR